MFTHEWGEGRPMQGHRGLGPRHGQRPQRAEEHLSLFSSQNKSQGASLVVQGLRLCAPSAARLASIPPLKELDTTCHS